MKKTVPLIISAIMLASGYAADARPGFTAGVYGGLATNGGPFYQTLDKKAAYADTAVTQNAASSPASSSPLGSSQSKRLTAHSACSLQYEFRSGLFIRSGVDYAVLASGGEVSYNFTSADYMSNYEYKFSLHQQAVIIPLYAGLSLFPAKSKVGVYGAIGVAGGPCTVSRSERYSSFTNTAGVMTSTTSTWKTKSMTTPVFGLSALIGIEANIWKHVSLTIEYVFNDISDAKEKECRVESVDGTGIFYSKSLKYTEHVGFPSQLVRFGARFTL